MTNPLVGREAGAPWTAEDLADLPDDDGNRYEILDGSLIVSPSPDTFHGGATTRLTRLLDRAAPFELTISSAGFGVYVQGGRGYCIPDLVAVRTAALDRRALALDPGDVPLVVEVISPTSADRDLVYKRHEYAKAGIRHYWIVDQDRRALTALRLDASARRYEELTTVKAGNRFETDDLFPISLDPADFC
jgi:Uma2 family endonuclease